MIAAGLVAGLAVWLLLWAPGPAHTPVRQKPPAGSDALGTALAMDLLAAAMAAGSTMPDALLAVAESGATRHGGPLRDVATRLRGTTEVQDAWTDTPADLEPLRRVVELVMEAGVPAVGLLRAGAAEARRRSAARAQVRAAQLGVRLVLPLGLCALPAFIAWSVMPVVLGLGSQLLR